MSSTPSKLDILGRINDLFFTLKEEEKIITPPDFILEFRKYINDNEIIENLSETESFFSHIIKEYQDFKNKNSKLNLPSLEKISGQDFRSNIRPESKIISPSPKTVVHQVTQRTNLSAPSSTYYNNSIIVAPANFIPLQRPHTVHFPINHSKYFLVPQQHNQYAGQPYLIASPKFTNNPFANNQYFVYPTINQFSSPTYITNFRNNQNQPLNYHKPSPTPFNDTSFKATTRLSREGITNMMSL